MLILRLGKKQKALPTSSIFGRNKVPGPFSFLSIVRLIRFRSVLLVPLEERPVSMYPAALKIKKVNLNKEVYSFFAKDGRFLSANLEELSTMWNLIPLGGERVNDGYIEWAFFNCIREKNTTEYIHPGIGEFIFVGEYAFDDYQSEEHAFSIRVHVDDVDDLRACCLDIDGLLDRIPELDRISRRELADKLSMEAEELEMINLDCLDYYKQGEFDLTYYLAEDAAVEYVRVCYSKDGLPVEATFGNF
jgi:hypothetical protein